MKSFHDAVAKLRDWLERNFDAVGLCAIDSEDSRYYYKTPYLMTMAGMRSRGGRVARQILEKFVAEDGELKSAAALANRVYAMGWIALGAVVAERFDLAHLMADRLEHYQDGRCGGIVLADEDAGEEVGGGVLLGRRRHGPGGGRTPALRPPHVRHLPGPDRRAGVGPLFLQSLSPGRIGAGAQSGRRLGDGLRSGGRRTAPRQLRHRGQCPGVEPAAGCGSRTTSRWRAATWTWSTATAPIPPISADRPSSAGPC